MGRNRRQKLKKSSSDFTTIYLGHAMIEMFLASFVAWNYSGLNQGRKLFWPQSRDEIILASIKGRNYSCQITRARKWVQIKGRKIIWASKMNDLGVNILFFSFSMQCKAHVKPSCKIRRLCKMVFLML